ncbi:MAG: fibronectin type III-like domain-contianing protein, partial [Gammaproteobacteria bacterium]
GQETGTAVADLLVGKVSPSGKMPVTVPRNVGQIPSFYFHKPTAKRGYAFASAQPLYRFGFGMSYSTFEMTAPILRETTIPTDGQTTVTVTVKNTGSMAADEIVQLYIRDKISSVTREVMALKGFQRVSLAPGESRQVTLPISASALQFYDRQMQRVVEPGEFDIMVGNSSDNHQSTVLTVE